MCTVSKNTALHFIVIVFKLPLLRLPRDKENIDERQVF